MLWGCDKSGEDDAQYVVSCMDADGDERVNLTEYGQFDALGYADGKLYFAEYDKGYGAIDITDDVEASAESAATGFIRIKGLHSLPVLKDDRLWYIDRLTSDSLTAYDPESGERLTTSFKDVGSFYILYDILVVSRLDSEGKACITTCYINKNESVKLFEKR